MSHNRYQGMVGWMYQSPDMYDSPDTHCSFIHKKNFINERTMHVRRLIRVRGLVTSTLLIRKRICIELKRIRKATPCSNYWKVSRWKLIRNVVH